MTTDFPRESRHCSVCGNCRTAPCEREDCGLRPRAPTLPVAEPYAMTILRSIVQDGYLSDANTARIHSFLASPLVGGDVLSDEEIGEIGRRLAVKAFADIAWCEHQCIAATVGQKKKHAQQIAFARAILAAALSKQGGK